MKDEEWEMEEAVVVHPLQHRPGNSSPAGQPERRAYHRRQKMVERDLDNRGERRVVACNHPTHLGQCLAGDLCGMEGSFEVQFEQQPRKGTASAVDAQYIASSRDGTDRQTAPGAGKAGARRSRPFRPCHPAAIGGSSSRHRPAGRPARWPAAPARPVRGPR